SLQINPLPLRRLQNKLPRLRIRRHVQRRHAIRILLIPLGPRHEQHQRRIPMPLAHRMMQRRHAIHIRRIERTLPLANQQPHHGHAPRRRRPMQRQLTPPILDPRTRRRPHRQQFPCDIEIVARRGKMQGRLAGIVLLVHVCVLGKQQVNDGLSVLARRRHHEGRPARGVRRVDVEGFELHKEGYDGEVVVGDGPVEGEAVVGVAEGGEGGVRVEEGFDTLGVAFATGRVDGVFARVGVFHCAWWVGRALDMGTGVKWGAGAGVGMDPAAREILPGGRREGGSVVFSQPSS
ncbi:hypothetical protein BS50DRAFT_652819, partial [Corynespora cassiicola Philippines]